MLFHAYTDLNPAK